MTYNPAEHDLCGPLVVTPYYEKVEIVDDTGKLTYEENNPDEWIYFNEDAADEEDTKEYSLVAVFTDWPSTQKTTTGSIVLGEKCLAATVTATA